MNTMYFGNYYFRGPHSTSIEVCNTHCPINSSCSYKQWYDGKYIRNIQILFSRQFKENKSSKCLHFSLDLVCIPAFGNVNSLNKVLALKVHLIRSYGVPFNVILF